jgi:isocitrate/isopropylmalate dehydrogenase
MPLEYLGMPDDAGRLEAAIDAGYFDGSVLTLDQWGRATATEFAQQVISALT